MFIIEANLWLNVKWIAKYMVGGLLCSIHVRMNNEIKITYLWYKYLTMGTWIGIPRPKPDTGPNNRTEKIAVTVWEELRWPFYVIFSLIQPCFQIHVIRCPQYIGKHDSYFQKKKFKNERAVITIIINARPALWNFDTHCL